MALNDCQKCGLPGGSYTTHICGPLLTTGRFFVEDKWIYTTEPATPLYIGPLPRIHADLQHATRRMLQALDAYWLGYDGLPKGRYPRGKYRSEDWWHRFEGYRAKVEEILGG